MKQCIWVSSQNGMSQTFLSDIKTWLIKLSYYPLEGAQKIDYNNKINGLTRNGVVLQYWNGKNADSTRQLSTWRKINRCKYDCMFNLLLNFLYILYITSKADFTSLMVLKIQAYSGYKYNGVYVCVRCECWFNSNA